MLETLSIVPSLKVEPWDVLNLFLPNIQCRAVFCGQYICNGTTRETNCLGHQPLPLHPLLVSCFWHIRMNARICRGYLGVFGPLIDDIAREYIAALKELHGGPEQQSLKIKGGEYHITIASKSELQGLRATGAIASDDLKSVLPLDALNADLQRPNMSPVIYGLGSNQQGVYWATGVWAAGQRFRSQLGLPPKEFHITLTSVDQHGINKVSAPYLILTVIHM